MPPFANNSAFLTSVPSSNILSTRGRFQTLGLSRTRPRLNFYNHSTTMAASLPDDTALDMISFALSGPGLAAFAVFLISTATLTFSFAEVGPRRKTNLLRSSFLLRVTLPSSMNVELPDGTVRGLRAGETVLRLRSYEACTAVARAMEQPGVSYTIYRADITGVRTLSTYPKPIDAKGSTWPRGIFEQADEGMLEARWEEYQRLGASSNIDEEWLAVESQLSPIKSAEQNECKLCGGSRTVRCHRCGGVSRRGGAFVCDCNNGRRPCDWCRPSSES